MRRRTVVLGVVAMLLGLVAAPSEAVSPLPIVCSGSGTITITGDSPANWAVSGGGSCPGSDFENARLVSFGGGGTSANLGLCSMSPVTLDLKLMLSVTFTDVVTGAVENQTQTWAAPVTTFPVVTPTLISTSDGSIGAGVFSTRIFIKCPGRGGSPSANFSWAQLT